MFSRRATCPLKPKRVVWNGSRKWVFPRTPITGFVKTSTRSTPIPRRTRPRGNEKVFKMPSTCPVCDSKLEREEEEVAWRCVNTACEAQVEGRIEHFCGRDAMDIRGAGPAVVKQLLEEKLIHDYADLYKLKR